MYLSTSTGSWGEKHQNNMFEKKLVNTKEQHFIIDFVRVEDVCVLAYALCVLVVHILY